VFQLHVRSAVVPIACLDILKLLIGHFDTHLCRGIYSSIVESGKVL